MGKTTSGKGRDRFFGFAPAPSISEPGFEWENGSPKERLPIFPICPCFERFRTGSRVEKRISKRKAADFFRFALASSVSEHVIFCFLRVVFFEV